MKISELIAKLEEIKTKHGDLDVRTYGDYREMEDVAFVDVKTEPRFTGDKIGYVQIWT